VRVDLNEIAKIYRDMAAEYRATAESFRMWPDQALALLRQAEECDAKAAEAETPRTNPD
jgi:hypothetical protein